MRLSTLLQSVLLFYFFFFFSQIAQLSFHWQNWPYIYFILHLKCLEKS